MSEWISVKDRLPRQGLTVLVILNDPHLGISSSLLNDVNEVSVDLSWLHNSKNWTCTQGEYESKNITHWMELPPIPIN